jgi:hypothetical protein
MTDVILVAIIAGLSGILGGGGIGLYLLKRKDTVVDLCQRVDRLAEGLRIGLENDVVIFEALRKKDINGNSKEQERKMQAYFAKCTAESYRIKKR